MGEEVAKYGMRPGRQTGHYSRFVKSKLGIHTRSTEHYSLDVPAVLKHDFSRTSHVLQVRPLHEIVHSWATRDTTLRESLNRAVTDRTVPPNYYTNPIVIASEPTALPVPVSIYIDAVPYTLTDSVVAIWVQNLISQQRSVIALIRKRIACRCGCRNWCTFYPVLAWLRYTFEVSAAGIFPDSRHDGCHWSEQDSVRQQNAGMLLAARCVMVQLRGDWSEFCERTGPNVTEPPPPPPPKPRSRRIRFL